RERPRSSVARGSADCDRRARRAGVDRGADGDLRRGADRLEARIALLLHEDGAVAGELLGKPRHGAVRVAGWPNGDRSHWWWKRRGASEMLGCSSDVRSQREPSAKNPVSPSTLASTARGRVMEPRLRMLPSSPKRTKATCSVESAASS